MVYTEVQLRNGKRYYYRVRSVRKGDKVKKIREYLGVNLSPADKRKKEDEADKLKELIFEEAKKAKKKVRILKIKKAGEIGVRRYRFRVDLRILD